MKFSHSLQFNAVPEWSSKYIAYTTLKKLIYSLQRDSLRDSKGDAESAYLVNTEYSSTAENGGDYTGVFLTALDAELEKIDSFYKVKEKEIFQNVDELIEDIKSFEREIEKATVADFSKGRNRAFSDISFDNDPLNVENDEDDEVADENLYSGSGVSNSKNSLYFSKSIDGYLETLKGSQVWKNLNGVEDLPPQLILLSDTRVILRKRTIELFTTLSELKSYIELNQTGFKKALKKFDKSLGTSIKDDYLNELPERTYIFKQETITKVNDYIDSFVKLYALISNHGKDYDAARSELSIHLREHIVWERNTVWRDMIGMERKTYAANQANSSDREKNSKSVSMELNLSLSNPKILKLLIIIIIGIILLNFSPFDDNEQRKCFMLVIVASLLWATETIPLFVTSLLIPILIVSLGVLKAEDGSVLNAPDSSKYILSTMWNSVILLLLGGFTLAAALSKYHIAKLISTWILSKAGTSPPIVLLTIMAVALFASMWVSNVAAPVLCFSLIQPLIRTIQQGSQFINALILGIALASNIGGMASPIASPQNMIAIGSMDPPPSWGEWFVIALPICAISLLLIWGFLLLTFDCKKNTHLVAIRTIDDKFEAVQWYIIFISVGTIFLWCIASKLEGIFGEMGIIALIPLIAFFGPGILTTEDFNNYPWNIVVLAMGGTALGKSVASSGLLTTIAKTIEEQVSGLSLFGVTLTFGFLILIMATFVSHTVAALIVIPLVSEIGNNMPEPHPRLLIMASALLCSAAMGLPTSGFPNVTAICMTDEFGKPYLTVNTFITRGVPSSIIAYTIIVTVGYLTMKIINF